MLWRKINNKLIKNKNKITYCPKSHAFNRKDEVIINRLSTYRSLKYAP